MTIEIVRGDILQSQAEALVNAVNCVGVMGKGVALQFRQAFPDNFQAYKTACKERQVRLGKMFVWRIDRSDRPCLIINFPTKGHWKNKSNIEDIKFGLVDLKNVVLQQQINSIAIPPLGCGLGGLNWEEVRSLIIETFQSLPQLTVYLYEPIISSYEVRY